MTAGRLDCCITSSMKGTMEKGGADYAPFRKGSQGKAAGDAASVPSVKSC